MTYQTCSFSSRYKPYPRIEKKGFTFICFGGNIEPPARGSGLCSCLLQSHVSHHCGKPLRRNEMLHHAYKQRASLCGWSIPAAHTRIASEHNRAGCHTSFDCQVGSMTWLRNSLSKGWKTGTNLTSCSLLCKTKLPIVYCKCNSQVFRNDSRQDYWTLSSKWICIFMIQNWWDIGR